MTPEEFKTTLKEYGIAHKVFAKTVLGINEKTLCYHLKKEKLPKWIEDALTLDLLKRDGVEIGMDVVTMPRVRR